MDSISKLIITSALCLVAVEVFGQQIVARKISATEGNFRGELNTGDDFGSDVVGIGDLDRDGVPDLAVRGGEVIWILFLNTDGSVKNHNSIPFGGNIDLAGDVNQDGTNDLARRLDDVRFIYLSRDGSGTMSEPVAYPDRPVGFSTIGDLDGDGLPEFTTGFADGRGGLTISFTGPDFSGFSFAGFRHNRGGFGEIALGDNTGVAAARLPSLETDTTIVLAVGEPGDDDVSPNSGLVWLAELSLAGMIKQRSGEVRDRFGISIIKNLTRIDGGSAGLQHPILSGDRFGGSIANLGDLDDDGVEEIAVGAAGDNGDGFNQGSVWIIFLNRDGSVKASRTFGRGDAEILVPLSDFDEFGRPVSSLGDVNGDGIDDLAVGAPGNEEEGGVWILFGLPALPSKVDLVDLTETPTLGDDILVEAEITGVSDIQSAQLNFRRGGDPSFFSAPMEAKGSSRFSFSIPAFAVNSRGIEYFVTTTNSGGGESRAPSEGVVSIPIVVPDGLDLQVPSGVASDSYKLVSVPLALDSTDARYLIEASLGSYDPTSWRLYSLTRTGEYADVGNEAIEIVPGRAYWLLSREPNRLLNSGPGTSVATDEQFPIQLYRGWTLVGNPFNFPIALTSLSTGSGTQIDMRSYDGLWGVAEGTFDPQSGYAVFSEQVDTLWIDPDQTPVPSSTTVQMPESSRKRASADWTIRIRAASGRARDEDNVAGVVDGAETGWDVLDRPEPPLIGDYVSVYFPHDEWRRATDRFSSDMRSAAEGNFTWKVAVECASLQPVDLAFDLESVPDHLNVWLVDRVGGVEVNLRTHPSYRLVSGVPDRSRIMEVVVSAGPNLAPQPSADIALRVFPNPINETASFVISLPENAVASLKIFDVLGRQVAVVFEGRDVIAGTSATAWDSRSLQGNSFASGLYFARLETGGSTVVRSIVIDH